MLVVINLYSVRMRENPDQKNSKYGHFSRSTKHSAFQNFVICRHTNMSLKIENEKQNRMSYLVFVKIMNLPCVYRNPTCNRVCSHFRSFLPSHCVKSVQMRSFFPYFPVFGLNTEIYGVNLRIQSEYGKIQTSRNSVLWHFSNSVFL